MSGAALVPLSPATGKRHLLFFAFPWMWSRMDSCSHSLPVCVIHSDSQPSAVSHSCLSRVTTSVDASPH